jgi:hypothetical protein
MAARFWVGGTGTWDATTTANWSATSGGAGGASVPGVGDDVTINTASITVTTDYNVSVISVTINASNATLSLGGTLTCTGAITLTAGTFTTNNFDVAALFLASSNANTRTINLGSSTITLSNTTATNINFSTSTGLTFNAGTSQINITVSGPTINTGGQTFYNVAFTSTANASTTRTINGFATFNNLSVAAPANAGVITVNFNAQQTINGTLSTTGTAGNRRVFFTTATYGISQDLVVNSAPSLTDADFRGLYVRGTAAPISGTRIGNRGECRGITFDAPKTVYWNLAGTQNWSANGWATTSTGTPSTDNFPLPQDTATFTNAGAITTITLDTAIPYIGNFDMSARTSAMFLVASSYTIYGNWINGSGTIFSGAVGTTYTFSGGGTQLITSLGQQFRGPITIDTYGGTVQLADALNVGSQALTVTNGTFDTAGYAVTSGVLSSSNSNVRTINLGASTCNFSSINWSTNTNLTFNAGTSQINITSITGAFNITSGTFTFYNVAYTGGAVTISTFAGALLTFNNLTFSAPAAAGISSVNIATNIVVNGTLTCAGASAVRRVFLQSSIIGTPRTLTVNAISAADCDFRDIDLAGAASGASPTRAGDCGGNTGITFPTPKTVYWNLAGAQNWSATGWATGSGGTPDINNFPLAQDTAVFDDTGSVTGTITINAEWNIGTFDASARTSAMTLITSPSPSIHGSLLNGTGITWGTSSGLNLRGRGSNTITSNGAAIAAPIIIDVSTGTITLADALSGSANSLRLNTGTFNASSYNVTRLLFSNNSASNTLQMGSGTWTLAGTGVVWNLGTAPILFAGTSNIVLSDTSASARQFSGGNLYYNKLTIGGTTGTSTLTITGNNTFGELASTKTVAHTIAFGTGTQTFGAWTVTGTAGNVVTITGTSTTNVIAGPAVTGVDYLAMGSWGISTTSPGEFYAGANSTGTAAAPVFRTAAPAPRTLYWVGGTGNWSSTTKWDTTSGGGGGAAIPTSLDAVNFNLLSNATAYTATIDAGVTLARCASFTMAGPLVGNVTFAGSVGIAFHGNVSFAATGITRTYSGAMQWAGNSSYTFTTNGLTLASTCTVIGIGSTWELGSAFANGNFSFSVTYGTFNTSVNNYSLTSGAFASSNSNVRSLVFNGSTLTLTSSQPIVFSNPVNLTFNAGTSTITMDASAPTFNGGNQTFNAAIFNQPASLSATIAGANTFNTLSFTGRTSVGISSVTFNANQTISTLTLSAGTASAFRTFLASNVIGTTRTLTVGTLTAGAADIDFRDITIAGAAAPISGTRFGDAKGNSGITFDAAKTVYYRQTGSANWGATGSGSWSDTSGSALDATKFPLAQDTAVFPAATYPSSGSTTTINAAYNIGTIDMSLRTTNTMTLATGSTTPQIYNDWINGTGTTLTGTGQMTFAGRGSQTITSAGKTFTQRIEFNNLSGSIALQDSFVTSATSNTVFTSGTLDLSGYTFSITGAGATVFSAVTGALARTVAFNGGNFVLAGGGSGNGWAAANSVTITGTGEINLTSAATKTFAGGGISYSGITLNQGGAGALTITGNNTFKDITNTYSATGATSINLGNTTQTLTSPWTATGEAGRVLTVSGTSAASPATLIFTGAGTAANVDYLAINNVRAYDLVDEWYAGPNSTNGGSLGWVYASGVIAAVYLGNFFAFF